MGMVYSKTEYKVDFEKERGNHTCSDMEIDRKEEDWRICIGRKKWLLVFPCAFIIYFPCAFSPVPKKPIKNKIIHVSVKGKLSVFLK